MQRSLVVMVVSSTRIFGSFVKSIYSLCVPFFAITSSHFSQLMLNQVQVSTKKRLQSYKVVRLVGFCTTQIVSLALGDVVESKFFLNLAKDQDSDFHNPQPYCERS